MSISSLIICLSSIGHAWEVKTNAQGDPLHWKTSTIPVHYNPDHSGLSSQQVSTAIEQAAQAWSYSFTTLQNEGETTLRNITHEDEHHAILFSDDWNEDPDRKCWLLKQDVWLFERAVFRLLSISKERFEMLWG